MNTQRIIPNSAVPFSSTELFRVFQLNVLVLWPTTVLIYSALKAVFSDVHYLPSTKWQTGKVSSKLVNIVAHLAAKESNISLRSWSRPKTELKEDWILDQMDTNTTQNEWRCCSMSAGCVNINFIRWSYQCCVYSLLCCPQAATQMNWNTALKM